MAGSYQQPHFTGFRDTVPPETRDIDHAIHGEYSFTIGEVFREAWQKVEGYRGAFWKGIVAVMLASAVGSMVSRALLGDTRQGDFFGPLLSLPLTGPLYMGLFMMGVRRAADEPVQADDVFQYFKPYHIQLLVVQVLVYLATSVGFLLLVIPGIYLAVSYAFASALVADKGLEPWQAMETARKTAGYQWWAFFGLFLTLGLTMVASAIPFLLGLIWTVPWSIVVLGVLYGRVFGLPRTRSL